MTSGPYQYNLLFLKVNVSAYIAPEDVINSQVK